MPDRFPVWESWKTRPRMVQGGNNPSPRLASRLRLCKPPHESIVLEELFEKVRSVGIRGMRFEIPSRREVMPSRGKCLSPTTGKQRLIFLDCNRDHRFLGFRSGALAA
jgi:hypothetical protein